MSNKMTKTMKVSEETLHLLDNLKPEYDKKAELIIVTHTRYTFHYIDILLRGTVPIFNQKDSL